MQTVFGNCWPFFNVNCVLVYHINKHSLSLLYEFVLPFVLIERAWKVCSMTHTFVNVVWLHPLALRFQCLYFSSHCPDSLCSLLVCLHPLKLVSLSLSSLQAMAGPRPVVLSGPSGAGKSTLVKKLLKEYDGVFGFSVSRKYACVNYDSSLLM